VQIAHGVHVIVETYIVRIGGVKHQAHIVPEPEPQIATWSAEADLLMYHSRADEIFAARQWLNMLCAAYRGNMRLVTVVMQGLNDSMATQEQGRTIAWGWTPTEYVRDRNADQEMAGAYSK